MNISWSMLFALIAVSSSLGALAAPVREVDRVHMGRIEASDVFIDARGPGLPDNGSQEKVEGISDNASHGSFKNRLKGVAEVVVEDIKKALPKVLKFLPSLDDQPPSVGKERRSL